MVWTSVEWTAFGVALSGIGTSVGAVALMFTAWLGSRSVSDWRDRKIAEIRMTEAEKLLDVVYRARDALTEIRNPFVFGDEWSVAESDVTRGEESSGSARKKELIVAQVWDGRLRRFAGEYSALRDLRPKVALLFGPDVLEAIEQIKMQFDALWSAVKHSRLQDIDNGVVDKSIREVLARNQQSDGGDRIEKIINRQVAVIQTICLREFSPNHAFQIIRR